MRQLSSDEVAVVGGGQVTPSGTGGGSARNPLFDSPRTGPYNDGPFLINQVTDNPSTSWVGVGYGDSSAKGITYAELGISMATMGQGPAGMAYKGVGKEATQGASDVGYTGSLLQMEGFVQP